MSSRSTRFRFQCFPTIPTGEIGGIGTQRLTERTLRSNACFFGDKVKSPHLPPNVKTQSASLDLIFRPTTRIPQTLPYLLPLQPNTTCQWYLARKAKAHRIIGYLIWQLSKGI